MPMQKILVCALIYMTTVFWNHIFWWWASSCSALEFTENQWSWRLVNALTRSHFEYLNGWEIKFWGTKVEQGDFDNLQKPISDFGMLDATTSYLFHGAPDIIVAKGNSHSVISKKVIPQSQGSNLTFQSQSFVFPREIGQGYCTDSLFGLCVSFEMCCERTRHSSKNSDKRITIRKNSGGYHVQLTANVRRASNTCHDVPPVQGHVEERVNIWTY